METGIAGRHVVVLGGAGFLGSHLCRRLVADGASVTALDNFITGSPDNVADLIGRRGFRLIRYDVTDYLWLPGDVHQVLHLASPASPVDYLRWPIQTLKVGSLGTHKALGLARAKKAQFLLMSTSEVYGDPQVSPQPEHYRGHVNHLGPRGVYDEAKRFAETLTMAYHREHALDVRIARTFNTYGPQMRIDDGRVIPAFFAAAIRDEPLPVAGDGSQTRSFCYVDDQVEGLMRLMAADYVGPVNLGSEQEIAIADLATEICAVAGNDPGTTTVPLPADDPAKRRPDTNIAREQLGWSATTSLREGLERTVGWFREALAG